MRVTDIHNTDQQKNVDGVNRSVTVEPGSEKAPKGHLPMAKKAAKKKVTKKSVKKAKKKAKKK
ncbi:MAG: hypothetical protein NTW19_02870 [Planctomycetota bacterium]|nr:hypothetical protein [Planctomycetota bacterium]